MTRQLSANEQQTYVQQQLDLASGGHKRLAGAGCIGSLLPVLLTVARHILNATRQCWNCASPQGVQET
eukprot:923979-Amphidinium_carterae.1